MSGGRSQTSSIKIPDLFKPAAKGAVENILGLQGAAPISQFTGGFAPLGPIPSPNNTINRPEGIFSRTDEGPSSTPDRPLNPINRPPPTTTQPITAPEQVQPANIGGQPFQTAGLNPLEQFAQSRVGDITRRPLGERAALSTIGNLEDRASLLPGNNINPIRIDSSNIRTSPNIRAALDVFEQDIAPVVERQARLAGVGSGSAVSNALARAGTSALLPLIESEMGREERVLDRSIGLNELNLGRNERGIDRLVGATGASINPLLNIGSNETGRLLNQIGTAERLGGTERGINQGVADRITQDFLRQQALAEQGTFVPFGAFAPSAIGSQISGRSGGVAGLLGK